MALRSIFAKVTADTTGFEAGMRRAAKSVTPFQQAVMNMNKISGGLTLLRGGAAFAGITIGVTKATQSLNKLAEALDDVDTGFKTTGELWRDVFRNIPIVGPFGQAIRGVTPLGRADRADLRASEHQAEVAAGIERDMQPAIDRANKFEDALKSARSELRKLAMGERHALTFELTLEGVDKFKIDELKQIWKSRDAVAAAIERRDEEKRRKEERQQEARHLFDSMKSRADSLFDSIKTPTMRFEESFKEVMKLSHFGFFGQGATGFGRAGLILGNLRDQLFPKQQPRATSSAFGEVDLTRTYIGEGASPVKKLNVEDVRVKETNMILKRIETKLGNNSVARAS